MKLLFVIFYISVLTFTIDRVQSTKLLLNTQIDMSVGSSLNLKIQTETSTNSKNKLSTSSSTKSNFKMRKEGSTTLTDENKSLSIMEYLNNADNAPTPKKSSKVGGHGVSHKNHTNVTIIKKRSENPDVILEDLSSLSLIKEGWLKISTPQFKNLDRFPKIAYPDSSLHDIPTENNYFRVNEGFDPIRNSFSPPSPFFFWFRLSFKNLYYSLSKESINVVGNIPIKDVSNAEVLKDYAKSDTCLRIFDVSEREWTLCGQTKTIRNEWVCKIKALKQLEEENECFNRLLADDAVVVEKKVTQPIVLIPQASPICNEDFTYDRKGEDWVCDCKEGKRLYFNYKK